MRSKRSSHKRKVITRVLVVISAILLSIVCIGYLTIHSYIQKMNLVTNSCKGNIVQAESQELSGTEVLENNQEAFNPSEEYEATDAFLPDSAEDEISVLEENIKDNLEENSTPVIYNKNVFNVLLIGCDTREPGDLGRSDSMILISLNKKTKKIIATSILRDIYLQIPGKKNNRVNAAYAFGGADLLLDTIEQNFKIKVDRYVSIDFFAFIDVVDAVGGVTIDVTKEEILVMNNFIKEINYLNSQEDEKDCMNADDEGLLKLNGKQALAYARNRYTGNADFERTARQRRVLEQIYMKVKDLNILELNDLLNKILPQVTTNLTEGELFSLILSSPSFLKYDIEQWSVPVAHSYQPMRIRKMDVLGIDFDENIKEMRKRIYNEEE